ncbi:MAG: hypothetical protein HOP19_20790 [Acidobacteria bacterium]|nr:hypothetical protein [Acidobacteriota bacterium]
MESLKRQEIINTPECKGMRTVISARPASFNAQQLPARYECKMSERRLAPVGRIEPAQEFRRLKAEALQFVAPATRRSRYQQADTPTVGPNSEASTGPTGIPNIHVPSAFAGVQDTGWTPPEGCLAVSSNHLMIAVNSACAVFDRAGRQLLYGELKDWFAPVSQGATIYSPKVMFDHQRGVWLLAACAREVNRFRSSLLLAVSQSSDPLQGWWVWSLDAAMDGAIKTTNWPDGLGLATDNSAIYLSANMFGDQGRFSHSKIRVLYKREAYAGAPLHGWDYWDFRNQNGTVAFGLQPASNFGSTDVQHFVNATQDGQSMTVWSITQPLRMPPQLARKHVATLSYRIAPNGRTGEGREIETGDTRLGNVVFRNGSLWTAHSVSANWGGDTNVAAIHWLQINPLTGSVTQQGIFGQRHHHYFCPAVMVDRHSRLMLVFNRVGPYDNPAICFTGRRANDRLNTLQTSALLKQSKVPGGQVWSACSSASLDPSGSDFWLMGQYAIDRDAWATWIGETTYAPHASDYPPNYPKDYSKDFRSPSVRSRSRRNLTYA